MNDNNILNDVIKPKLNLIFCGTAAGNRSARIKAYYAGQGNKFWSTIYKTKIVDRLIEPADYSSILDFNIGLTDIAKNAYGNDSDISRGDYDSEALLDKIKRYKPKIVCFNGKNAGKVFYNKKNIDYGLQPVECYNTKIFIAPSTSGAANGFWNIDYWYKLSSILDEI